MFDPCCDAAEALATFLRENGFSGARAGDLCLSPEGADVSTALPIAMGLDAEAASHRLTAACGAFGPELYGAPLIALIRARCGYLLFTFTPEAFRALARRAIAELPPPEDEDILTPLGHALAKLSTVARKGKGSANVQGGCPDAPCVRQALWHCAAALAYPGDKRRTRARLNEAIASSLAVLTFAPKDERAAFLGDAYVFADAARRMIFQASIQGR